jgi:hypothetical protein
MVVAIRSSRSFEFGLQFWRSLIVINQSKPSQFRRSHDYLCRNKRRETPNVDSQITSRLFYTYDAAMKHSFAIITFPIEKAGSTTSFLVH